MGRSLDLLEAVAADDLGLVGLAERTNLGPSTAYRLLATLADRGYVTRSPTTGRYRLGHKLVELAATARRHTESLRSAVRPHLERLGAETNETANLVLPEGHAIVYIDQVESPRSVRMFTTIGRRVPLHACAGGKAILAFAPKSLLEELVAKGLDRLTSHTLATAADLEADLEVTRRRGFATDQEEYEAGVVCVAAPVLGPDGEPVAAVTVSGPAARMLDADLDTMGALVRAHARQASRELGSTSR